MIVEIVSTGTELLLGQIVNTNAVWLAQQLNAAGFHVLYQTTVGDNRERMTAVLQAALDRADIVITSGGLGPTLGDITKEVGAAVMGRELYLHEPTVARLESYFSRRQLVMAQNNLRQAMAPADAVILDNDNGTAPGIIMETGGKVLIHLPGPPRELKPMFTDLVCPYLKQQYGPQGIILSRVLRLSGMGESTVAEVLQELISSQSNPTIALLAKPGEIHIRLTAQGATAADARKAINEIEPAVRAQLDQYIFGADDETLEVVVGNALRERNLTVALAESCTGGLITGRLTDIAGSSDYLVGSVVCYSNRIKESAVGVPADILTAHGAVSEETALSMARQIRSRFGSDIGVGVTGIAGPGGATAAKAVGLVYLAIDGSEGSRVYPFQFGGQRTVIRQRAVQAALFELYKYVTANAQQ